MISKGTAHNNGVKLAAYMTTGKDGERAELWELRGFGATNIKDAFRDVQIMAEATKATQPFFHIQVRNRDGEKLNRQQWEYAAKRIEGILGLADQPRAIAFHIDERTGEEHMHVAWCRIDQETMKAIPLPFFKDRLKKISRELELHFGLEPVTNRRKGHIQYAPKRTEDEQARRLGLDIHEIRNAIRSCWDHSDCGRSFQGALEHEGMILAQGEKRDFVIVDREGGIHALGKRIVDMTASKIRDRLSDVSRDHLPTVEMARTFIEEAKLERLGQERDEPAWDRDREDQVWQDAVIKAAIDKEEIEQAFLEPEVRQERAGVGSRKIEEVGLLPKNLKGEARTVWSAYSHSDGAHAFAAALDQQGVSFAVATKEEAARSDREAGFARAIGRYAPSFREGEIVIVTEQRPEFRRDGEIVVPSRIHKLDQALAEEFIHSMSGRETLLGIDAALQVSDQRAQKRAEQREARQLEYATDIQDFSRALDKDGLKEAFSKTVSVAENAVNNVGKTLDAAGDAIASLFAPTLTPTQIRDGERAKATRKAEGERAIDFTRFTAEMAHARLDEEREVTRRQERRGRER